MGEKINDKTQIYSSANGFLTIWTYNALTNIYSPGEKIAVQDFLSTGTLDTEGIEAWQTMLKQAIASDSLRNLAGANAYTQTAENGVYITSITTTNLPDTNLIGTLEVYNSGTTKYLRYQTYNVGKIEIWTNYYNGATWGTWNYANGDSSFTFADGLTESGGVVRQGGALTADVEIDLAGFKKAIVGEDSEFSIEILNTGSGLTASLIIGSNVVLSFGNYAITIDSTGLLLSDYPLITNQRALPSNDAALAVGNSVYWTDADTLNMPSTTLVGILECFDHNESGDIALRYTTYITDGQIQVWGRKKTGGSWYDWALLSGGSNSTDAQAIHKTTANEIHSLTAPISILDADELLGENSSGGAWSKIRISFSLIKSTLKTYFDGIYTTLVQLAGRQMLHGVYSLPANPSFTGNVYTLPGSTPYSVYIGSTKYDISTAKTIDISALAEWIGYTHAQRQGQWFIWMYILNGSPTLNASKTSWDILDETAIPIDTAYANDAGSPNIEWILSDEKHAAKRNLLMHKQEHDTDGARWVTGLNTLAVGSGVVNNATNTFSLAGGVIRDEDKYHTISNPQTQCRIGYKNGATNAMLFDSLGTGYCKLNAGVPQYDSSGTLTDIPNLEYGIIWQFATNRYNTPIVHILGQSTYASITAAQLAPLPTLYGLTIAEWKVVNRIIVRSFSGALQWKQTDPLYQTTSGPAVGGGGISTLPASSITFIPAGEIASTNMQSVSEELDTEKYDKTGGPISGDVSIGSNSAGKNEYIYATLGTNSAPALETPNYTLGTGWSYGVETIEKLIDGTGTITPVTQTITAGKTYKVVVTIGSISVSTMSWTLGGVTGSPFTAATTYTEYITASTTGKLIITPVATALRTSITAISVKELTDVTGDLTIEGNLLVGGAIKSIGGVDAMLISKDGNIGLGKVPFSTRKLDILGDFGVSGAGTFGNTTSIIMATGAVYNRGYVNSSSTQASAGVKSTYSPMNIFQGYAWDTSSSKLNSFGIILIPVSASTTYSRLVFIANYINGVSVNADLGGPWSNGNWGFGITTLPTAWLELGAGTANKAPLKLTSGTLATGGNILAGNIEFLNDAFYATITTGLARKTIAFLESPAFTGDITANNVRKKAYQSLTSTSNATPMNINTSANAKATLTENTTITLSNLVDGDEGNIVITQAAGNYTVAISPTPYIINDGAGLVSIEAGAGSITVLSYAYDGSRLLINYGKNYTNS